MILPFKSELSKLEASELTLLGIKIQEYLSDLKRISRNKVYQRELPASWQGKTENKAQE